MYGMNLYNVLRALPIKLTVHNVGNVDSIGNAVFLAGSPRYACPHSTFMFHGVGFDISQGARLEEKLLTERLASQHQDAGFHSHARERYEAHRDGDRDIETGPVDQPETADQCEGY